MVRSDRTNMRFKLLAAFLIPAIAASAILTSTFLSNSVQTNAIELKTQTNIQAKTAKQYFEEGIISHLIKTYPATQMIELKRGETTTVPIVVEHLSTAIDDVKVGKFHNEIRNFMPSAYEGLTQEDFLSLIEDEKNKGKLLSGEIDVNKFVSFSETKVTVGPNSATTVLMTISLPESLSDETVGRSLDIGLAYEIQSDGAKALGKAGHITVKVIA